MATYDTLLSNSQKQYESVLGQYHDRISGLSAKADVLGKNQLEQSANYWTNVAGQTYQNAWGAGLNNSTIKNSMMNNVAYQQSMDTNQINNATNQAKLSLEQQTSGDYLSAYERSLQALTQQSQFQQQLGVSMMGHSTQPFVQQANGGYSPGSSQQGYSSLGSMSNDFSASLGSWADLNNPGGAGLSLYPGGQRSYAALVDSFNNPGAGPAQQFQPLYSSLGNPGGIRYGTEFSGGEG